MSDVKAGREFLKARGLDVAAKKNWVTDQNRGLPEPPRQKPCTDNTVLIALPPAERLTIGRAPFSEVVARRASHRAFTADPVSMDELAFLLWATQGVRKTETVDGETRIRRTVPSAGARYVFETYVVVERVSTLEPGLYRYLFLDHKLALIRKEARLIEKLSQACAAQEWIRGAALAFVWTALPYRAEWRYAERSHKMIAQDSGHVCQNLYLACTAVGLGMTAVGAYIQPELDRLLGVDGSDEFAIYAAPMGRVKG